MYTILADGKTVYAPNLARDGYGVISPKLTLELNKAGSLTFVLPPNNVMYDGIKKLKSIVTVFDDEEEIFRGRVLHDEKDFYNKKSLYCEGELSFFVDSIQKRYDYQGTLDNLFGFYINNHNKQVEEEKQFTVGQITVTDNNDYVHYSSSQYPNTWDELVSKLVNTHGGYIRTRLSNGVRYVDYIEDYNSYSSQVIEFGVNMLDISEYISADEVFTVLIPLGAEIKSDLEEPTRLTVQAVNNGKDYIEDADAIALFGRIWRVQKWDNVTIASNLLTKGKEFLKRGIEMAVTITIKAIDLHLLNVDTERIKLGDYVRVVSLPHKLDKYFQCTKIVIDLVNPDKTEFTLGSATSSMTEKQVNNTRNVQNTIAVVQDNMQKMGA